MTELAGHMLQSAAHIWDEEDAVEEFAAALDRVRARRCSVSASHPRTNFALIAAKLAARPVGVQAAKLKPTEHAPNRESCTRCGIPGSKGCDHWLPCEAGPVVPKFAASEAAEPAAHSGGTVKRLSPEELAFVDARRDMPRKDLRAAFVAQFPDRPISVTSINYILNRAAEGRP